MVAPDNHATHVRDMGSGVRGELSFSPVMVEAHHGGEVPRVQLGSIPARNQCVGIGRITDDQHSDIARGYFVQRLTLGGENLSVAQE